MARRNQPRGRPDGCAVETRALSPLIHAFVKRWRNEHLDLAAGADIDRRDSRGRLGGNEILSAVTILHERTVLNAEAGGRPVTKDAISNVLRERRRHTELWVADALVAAIELPHAFHDGTLEIVPNPSASRGAQDECRDCCGGSLNGSGEHR